LTNGLRLTGYGLRITAYGPPFYFVLPPALVFTL